VSFHYLDLQNIDVWSFDHQPKRELFQSTSPSKLLAVIQVVSLLRDLSSSLIFLQTVPPSHTGIGIMSSLIVALEENPYQPLLTPDSTFFKTLQCFHDHAADIPKRFKKDIEASQKSEKARNKLAKEIYETDKAAGVLFTTTQAVDIIKGGIKGSLIVTLSS
jgi:hypothetical protein